MKTSFLPLVIAFSISIFRFHTEQTAPPKIWALKYDGTRSVEIEPSMNGQEVEFSVQAVTQSDTYFAYEVEW